MQRGPLVVCGGVLAGLLALAGCGSSGDEGTSADAQTRPSRPTGSESQSGDPEESASPSPSPSPSPTPAPTATAAPPTVDPSDIQACYDGDCTITVVEGTEIPLDGELWVVDVIVDSIDAADGVYLVAHSPSGFTGYLNSQRPNQGGPVTLDFGPDNVENLAILVLEINGEAATIRLSPH